MEPPLPQEEEQFELLPEYVPAGFFLRALAQAIDLAILATFVWCLHRSLNALPESFVLEVVGGTLPGGTPREIKDWDSIALSLVLETILSYLPSFLFVGTLFLAHLESGSLQASPGKLLLNLHVQGLDGERLGFPRALVRNFLKIFSAAALGLGFFPVLVSPMNQSFHDRLSGSIVLRPPRVDIIRVVTMFFLLLFSLPGIVSIYARGFRVADPMPIRPPSPPVEYTAEPVIETPEPETLEPPTPEVDIVADRDPYSLELIIPTAVPTPKPALPVVNIWGQSHQFQKTVGLIDIELRQIFIALFLKDSPTPSFEELAKGGTLNTLNPDVLITLNFRSLAEQCSPETLSSYSITFYRRAGGLTFPGERDFLQFGRSGTWKNREEIGEISCSLPTKGPSGFHARFRHFGNARNGLEDISFLWVIPIDLELAVR